jgi:D-3-phosphoglycerate dehydrogenase
MDTHKTVLVVVPGDTPLQIADSPHLERLRSIAHVQVHDDRPTNDDEHIRRVRDADVVINSRGTVRWPAEILRQLPRLRMMTTCSIGVDAIDLDAARDQGIVVCNVPGRTAQVVAEHALALMLGAARRLAFTTATVKAGGWKTPRNIYLRGKTLGVIGTGAIGREMIALGKAIGMLVQAWTFNPSAEREASLGVRFNSLEALLATSDVVSLHVKLTAESHHLLGAKEFASMKPGSLLVNTARGPVVDTDALIEALNSGRLAGAALDVFDQEPLPPDSRLFQCEQIVLTPHCADQSPEGMDLLNGGAVDNILAWMDGTPQNMVT